jgi:hypothetical protein
MNDAPWPPVDDNPKHIEIMEGWARRIIQKVADELAKGVVEELGRILLEQKTINISLDDRMSALERAFEARTKRKGGKQP